MGSMVSRRDLRRRPTAVDEAELLSAVAERLSALGMSTAPHVLAKLLRRLGTDAVTVIEVVAELSPAQRSGQRMLPRPLPLVASMLSAFDTGEMCPDDRDVLLVASLIADGRLEVLVAACGESSAEELADRLSDHLMMSRGHYRFTDARMSVWVQQTAAASARRAAHARISEAYERLGEELRASWHRACGALRRIPDAAPALAAHSRALATEGHSEWAYLVATEAADHAMGVDVEEARFAAGIAALGAGCMEEAAEWLGSLFPSGDMDHRIRALAALQMAQASTTGIVTGVEPADHRPRCDIPAHWRAWARTAGLAAVVSAERGETSAMREWLFELRTAELRSGSEGRVRDSAVAMCWMLSGEQDRGEVATTGAFSANIVAALQAALDDDVDLGLQILARARAGLIDVQDDLTAGFERSALIDAYLAVAEVLLHFWSGDIAAARVVFQTAAMDLPIGVPFAGLAVALGRRLDIAAVGAPGALVEAVSATLPRVTRVDTLLDAALQSYLRGDTEQAALEVALWQETGAPASPLTVPCLDEVGPIMEVGELVEAPDLRRARQLRRRLRLLPEKSWRAELAEIAELSKGIRSPYSRGRVEAMLGTACLSHGDEAGGQRFLRVARSLFASAGADAWSALMDRRLRALEPVTASAPIPTRDPIRASRVAWMPLLTERELDVAMRIVEGATNRLIAEEFHVSVRTIEVHAGRIFAKLGVRSRVELTVLAHRAGRHL